MEEKKVQVEAILEHVSTLKDRTLKLVFYTNELPPDTGAALMGMAHEFGYLLFGANPHREESIPAFPEAAPKAQEKKSQSQRLRASLYRLWEARGSNGDFEAYYKTRMEHMILWVQSQIDVGGLDDRSSTQ